MLSQPPGARRLAQVKADSTTEPTMRYWTVTIVAVVLTALAMSYAQDAAQDPAEQPAVAEAADAADSLEHRMSYLAGYQVGLQLSRQFNPLVFEMNDASLLRGLKDAMDRKPPAIDRQVIQATVEQFEQEMPRRMAALARSNAEAGREWLAENATAQGVKTTDSGLQYKVLVEGEGPSPKPTDRVRVHYEGKLLNGDVFDSSYRRGEPAEFQLNRVIRGWTEGVGMMKPGATYMLYVPGKLGYRDNPEGPGGPNSTLIFKVELLEIIDEPETAPEDAPVPPDAQGGEADAPAPAPKTDDAAAGD
jgi:FKBP-type peptidyl-prolyl cis-trans isomerase